MRIGIGIFLGAAGGSSGGGAPALTDGNAVLRVDSFAADGTWTRPTLGAFWGLTGDVNKGQVDMWAPGAGGTTDVGGGAGGDFSRGANVDLSGKASFAITGLAGAAANTNATDASFGGGIVLARGNLSGGNGGTAGPTANVGDTSFAGGLGQIATGTRIGGAGAGSGGAATTSTPGVPNGGGAQAAGDGREPGGGGGSSAAAQFTGAPGRAQVSYQQIAAAGFARLRTYSEARTPT